MPNYVCWLCYDHFLFIVLFIGKTINRTDANYISKKNKKHKITTVHKNKILSFKTQD